MEQELLGQGSLKLNREERVGVHLAVHNKVIIQLNGMTSTDQTGQFPIVS